MIPGLNRFLRRLPHRDRRKGWCIILFRSWKAIRVIPDLIPKSREHLCFNCLAPSLRYSGHRSLMDSSLDVRIAKKQIGPDVEAAIGDTSCGRHGPWFPAKIAALGT